MKYVNAKTILPHALVEELQTYLQGGYLYVPASETQQKRWGELSGYRTELEQRNHTIVEKHREGASVAFLAEQYCLSVSAIRKIIYRK